jgi:metal-dependent amidase/aminoacylase/carboxypeptidase family protein
MPLTQKEKEQLKKKKEDNGASIMSQILSQIKGMSSAKDVAKAIESLETTISSIDIPVSNQEQLAQSLKELVAFMSSDANKNNQQFARIIEQILLRIEGTNAAVLQLAQTLGSKNMSDVSEQLAELRKELVKERDAEYEFDLLRDKYNYLYKVKVKRTR